MKETEMSMTTTTTSTTTLPAELIVEILSYLPAKSLLNSCKRVCKSWGIVVEEPDFIKKHLNRGAINGGATTTQSSTLIFRSGKGLYKLHLPLINFEDVVPSSSSNSTTTDDHTVTIKPTKLFDSMSLFNSTGVASCNGLVCIGSDEFLILLNPCTREHKLSPKEPLQYRNRLMPISYGFGCFHDHSTTTTTTANIAANHDQYKVVRIEHSLPASKSKITSSKSHVKVYSLATNSWRRVKDIPNDILEMITKVTTLNRSGLFLNGALHWMNHETSDLVSFDMGSEEFRIMPRPPYDGNKDIKDLMIMRGCLGMTRIREIKGSCDLEISIMKEYGVSESWTHEFVIRLGTRQVGLYGLCSILWLDDQILLEGIAQSVVYDMNKKMSVYIDIQNPNCGSDLVVRLDDKVPCIESLVSLKSSELAILSKDKKRKVETLDTEINQ